MTRKLIDLAVPLQAGIASDPPSMLPQIDYSDHDEGAELFAEIFGIPVDKQLERKGAAAEELRISTHSGTHMDAPWHFHPTMNNGEPAWTIDQVPLEWCWGRGVKLDFRHFADGHVVTAAEIDAELSRIDHVMKAGDIVLVNTRAGSRYGYDDYVDVGCGMGREATLHLTKLGMRVCGTDGWTWDSPLKYQLERIKKDGDYSKFWEGHKAGAETVYFQMEKLGNLEALPSTNFDVICFPCKVEKASAGWCRPVAVIED